MSETWRIITLIVVISSVWALPSDNKHREARFWGRGETVTKLLVDNLIVTTIVPASCVAYEPTLRKCRNFRFLYYAATTTPQLAKSNGLTEAPNVPSNTPTPPLGNNQKDGTLIPGVGILTNPIDPKQNGTGGWGDYFNFIRGITITKTATRLVTETIHDPKRMVTFSIKHCLPSHMPFNLQKCPELIETEAGPIVNIDPVPSIPEIVRTTLPEEHSYYVKPNQDIEINKPNVEKPVNFKENYQFVNNVNSVKPGGDNNQKPILNDSKPSGSKPGSYGLDNGKVMTDPDNTLKPSN